MENEKQKPKSKDLRITVLLLIIAALLGFNSWTVEQQFQESKKTGLRFQKFQIEMTKVWTGVKSDMRVDDAEASNIYKMETHPNTLRSERNEKDIIKIKSDVTNIKSIIK